VVSLFPKHNLLSRPKKGRKNKQSISSLKYYDLFQIIDDMKKMKTLDFAHPLGYAKKISYCEEFPQGF